ncbi:MAG: hypothetical protein IPL52_13315 [Flavobacteriales bacterium]|nr:hypothetical protein [Flavobacteriales bacterium]
MRRGLVFLIFSVSVLGTNAQLSGVDQIQAVIAGPLTAQAARTLGDHLAERPGVLLCRVDPISRNLLLHIEAHSTLSATSLEHYMAIHGLHLRCYVRRPRTSAPFHLLDPRTCGSMEQTR